MNKNIPRQVYGDSPKLKRMFHILISNGIKFSPRGKNVNVALEADDVLQPNMVCVTFSVRDSGPGISEEVIPLLFQPFGLVRPGDFSEDEDRGSGLSLCLLQHIANLMSFKVSVSTKNGSGSIFKILMMLEMVQPSETKQSLSLVSSESCLFQTLPRQGSPENGLPLTCTHTRKNALSSGIDFSKMRCLLTKVVPTQEDSSSAPDSSIASPTNSATNNQNKRFFDTEAITGESSTGQQSPLDLSNFCKEGKNSEEKAIQGCISPSSSKLKCNSFREVSRNGEPFLGGIGGNDSKYSRAAHSEAPLSIQTGKFQTVDGVGFLKPQAFAKISNVKREGDVYHLNARAASYKEAHHADAKNVLIVDDVRSNVKMMEMILSKEGFACDVAFNGQEAVDLCRLKHYNLILMDNVMPVMNGIDATRTILSFDGQASIVGITGNILQSDQHDFLKAGAKQVVEKPVDKAKLLQICNDFAHSSQLEH